MLNVVLVTGNLAMKVLVRTTGFKKYKIKEPSTELYYL